MNDKRQCCIFVATQRETIWRILLIAVSIGGLLPTRRQAIIWTCSKFGLCKKKTPNKFDKYPSQVKYHYRFHSNFGTPFFVKKLAQFFSPKILVMGLSSIRLYFSNFRDRKHLPPMRDKCTLSQFSEMRVASFNLPPRVIQPRRIYYLFRHQPSECLVIQRVDVTKCNVDIFARRQEQGLP